MSGLKHNVGMMLVAVVLTTAGAAPATAAVPRTAASAGPVWGFGENARGQLGTGSFTPSSVPVQAQGIAGIVQVAGGAAFVLALRSDGTVWAWGYNGNGQLGNNTTTDSSAPVQVQGLSGVVAIAAGRDHSLALRSDGTVWAWGYNGHGELGDNSATDSSVPVPVSGLTRVVAIAGGATHSLAVRSDGTVWAWGGNSDGELGNNSTADSSVPVLVSGLTGVVQIAGGASHSLALKSDGTVWAWGSNQYGQLGYGSSSSQSTSPVQVSGLAGVVQIAGGYSHSLALKSDGTVWTWGYNNNGQLGNNTTTSSSVAVQAQGLTGVVQIAGGYSHSLALKSDGSVWAWGQNTSGQLGDGTTTDSHVPVQSPGAGHGAVAIAAGPVSLDSWVIGAPYASQTSSRSFTPVSVGSVSSSQPVTVTNQGLAPLVVTGVVFGSGDTDQFKVAGDGCTATTVAPNASCTINIRYAPTAAGPASAQLRVMSNTPAGTSLSTLSGSAYPAPASGLSFTMTPDPLFATGYGGNGQLGNGGFQSTSVASAVKGLSLVAASAGGLHTVALKPDGTVWAWGDNSGGQLGIGSTVGQQSPVEVPAPGGMVAVAAGASHTLALRSDGTVWAWGSNQHGQLGYGSSSSQSTSPVQVSGLTGGVAIAAGGYHSLALRSDGTVWSWGYNAYGQLGNNSTANSTVPVLVMGPSGTAPLSGVVAIAAGSTDSLALKGDGTVWAWGDNTHGQLGNNSTANSRISVQAQGLTGVTQIAAGGYHSLALKGDGTVWAWGRNSFGQLGNGTTTDSHVPGAVSNLSGVTEISAGSSHSLAIDTAGRGWAWGSNGSGQFGNGTTTNSSVPVQMTSLGNGAQALGGGSSAGHTLVIGQPYASLSTTKLTYGSQAVGTTSISQPVTVTNNGSVALTLGPASIVGQDGDEFTFAGDGCSGTSVKPGGGCQISIRFTPKVSGNPVATLRIPSNSPTSIDLVTLDPHAYDTAARAHPVRCRVQRTSARYVWIGCRTLRPLAEGAHPITLRLAGRTMRGVLHGGADGFTARILRPWRRGVYTLTITTARPATRSVERVRV